MAVKQRKFLASQIGRMCGLSKVTILKHHQQGKLGRVLKKDPLTGTFFFSRARVRDYLFTQHCIKLEEVE